MNSQPPSDPDPLTDVEERRLRQLFRHETSDYIDDAGFTARVMGRLPAARRRRESRRTLLVGLGALLGCTVAALRGGEASWTLLRAGWAFVEKWSEFPVPGLEAIATAGSIVALVGALVVAGWYTRREA
jgi:hypothetical protein